MVELKRGQLKEIIDTGLKSNKSVNSIVEEVLGQFPGRNAKSTKFYVYMRRQKLAKSGESVTPLRVHKKAVKA